MPHRFFPFSGLAYRSIRRPVAKNDQILPKNVWITSEPGDIPTEMFASFMWILPCYRQTPLTFKTSPKCGGFRSCLTLNLEGNHPRKLTPGGPGPPNDAFRKGILVTLFKYGLFWYLYGGFLKWVPSHFTPPNDHF